jgi:uncharacterized protein with NRDE domain
MISPMCLIVFAYEYHPLYRLVLCANRDEFFDRPTAPAGPWKEAPDLIAGKDLRAGGTWLGITRGGRIAAVTNYREPGFRKVAGTSRGALVTDFLTGPLSPADHLEALAKASHTYNGFNLLLGDARALFYFSNRSSGIQNVPPGIHGLSNRHLDTPWPKVEKAKAGLDELLAGASALEVEALFTLLTDRSVPPDDQLPDTGVGLEWERLLSSMWIAGDTYGTRSSSILLWEKSGRIEFYERTFCAKNRCDQRMETRHFGLRVQPPAPRRDRPHP